MSRFDEAWPALERRVRSVLSARGVRGEELHDLTQETGLRLFRAWDTLDPERPVQPYATTIALNAWRDGLKRAATHRETLIAAVPEQPDAIDVERTVLARLEVSRVSAALRLLRERDRDALMAEESGPAHRMARMRARRELLAAMERASAFLGVLLGLRHLLRPKVGAVAVSAGALTLVSLVFNTPTTSAPRIDAAPAIVTPHMVAKPVAHPVAKPGPSPKHVVKKVHHVVKKVVHKATPTDTCSGDPSSPPPDNNNGLPVGAQILGPDSLIDVSVKPTGTRVRSQNDGCTQVVTGP